MRKFVRIDERNRLKKIRVDICKRPNKHQISRITMETVFGFHGLSFSDFGSILNLGIIIFYYLIIIM